MPTANLTENAAYAARWVTHPPCALMRAEWLGDICARRRPHGPLSDQSAERMTLQRRVGTNRHRDVSHRVDHLPEQPNHVKIENPQKVTDIVLPEP